ncbi:hypothetical protein [Cerasicoccus maritimus]|uniref:hypothetical protein n=1 Tax=Cerasicoccus maritimus TaxID=490089 RepID=UPI002852698F|nr:hypothetical protein [Cerasicoccus maritimus]
MEGINYLYISGSATLTEIKSGSLSGAGEFVIGRQGTNSEGAMVQKNYNYAFGVDAGDNLYFMGPNIENFRRIINLF